MSVSGVSPNIAPLLQSVLDVDKQLNTLQQQLSSGQKSTTYGGLGAQSGIAVSLNAQLAAMSSYDDTITSVGTSISLQQQVLQQISQAASTVQDATVQQLGGFSLNGNGQTTVQQSAQDELNLVLSGLNTQGGNGYLFSGSAVDQPSVETVDHILNGNGAAAGLKQVIDERNQADLGSRRARPAGDPGGCRLDRVDERGRRRLAVRPQARRGQFVADQRGRHRPLRVARRHFSRYVRRQSERRRQPSPSPSTCPTAPRSL